MNDRYVHRGHNRRYCPPGDRKQPVYQRQSAQGLAPKLVQIGETDTQDLIQSYADECDVNKIVARYANGETQIVQRVQGVYTDIAGLPSDLTTAFETVNAAKAYYNSLPDAVKKDFGSLGKFLDSVRTVENAPKTPANGQETKKEDKPA